MSNNQENKYLKELSIKKLFKSGNYIVPIYQRNYAWSEKEITQLSIKENTHIGIYEYLSFSKPDRESYLYNMTEDFKEMFIGAFTSKGVYIIMSVQKDIDVIEFKKER